MKQLFFILLVFLVSCSLFPPYSNESTSIPLEKNNHSIFSVSNLLKSEPVVNVSELTVLYFGNETLQTENKLPLYYNNSPKTYVFYDYYEGKGGVVVNSKRNTHSPYGEYSYYDFEKEDLFVSQGKIKKSDWIEFIDYYDLKNLFIPWYAEEMDAFSKYNLTYGVRQKLPKSPVDWMQKFYNSIPNKIDKTIYTFVNPKTQNEIFISYSLHFENSSFILRFHPTFNVPVVIEELKSDNSKIIRFISFEVVLTDEFGIQKNLTKEVTLPDHFASIDPLVFEKFVDWQGFRASGYDPVYYSTVSPRLKLR